MISTSRLNSTQPPIASAGVTDPLIDRSVGAHVGPEGVTYRVWAPGHEKVRVALGGNGQLVNFFSLEPEGDGYFSGIDRKGMAGDFYRFFLDERTMAPDVASRYQPFGVFGPSMVVDPCSYAWRTRGWTRPSLRGRVIYELHVGTFTSAGTFLSAIERLDHLVDLGVNTIELMPLADFPGRWNWGYDGVMLFAPARCYGQPDDLRRLVDAAHERGLAVVLDVVYNHFGPAGNHLHLYSSKYFHPEKSNPWGQMFNFDAEDSRPVRSFFVQNALYWLDEYRIDGLRLDATHAVDDSSPRHLFAEVAAAARSRGAFTIAEDDRNEAKLLMDESKGGWGLTGAWADDFHHTIRVAMTGQNEGHFGSYQGTAAEWEEVFRRGWLYHGQLFPHWQKPRGTSAEALKTEQLVWCISNHDQVGNRALGDRLNHTVGPEEYRAASVVLCLTPYTPLLFMGQEWAASSPFLYFTDHPGELGELIAAGRLKEFQHTWSGRDGDLAKRMPHPQDRETFLSSKLIWDELPRPHHATVLELYRECLKVRREHGIFQNPPRESFKVQALGPRSIALRWTAGDQGWLMVWGLKENDTNSGPTAAILTAGEGRTWNRVLSSNEVRFGGTDQASMSSLEVLLKQPLGSSATLFREE